MVRGIQFDPEFHLHKAKTNFLETFHNRWVVDFYHGCGSTPYCMHPFYANGFLPGFEFNGNADIVPDLYGWSVKGAATESADRYGVDGASITWAPPLEAGTFALAFRAARNSNAAPNSNKRSYFHYGDKTLASTHFSIRTTGITSELLAGWSSGGSTGMVSSGLAPGGTPLWLEGDLVQIFMIYATGIGQSLYISNNADPLSQIGASATCVPAAFTGANARVCIGGGEGDIRGTDEPIFYATFLRHVKAFREKALAAQETFTWPFYQGPVSESALTLLGFDNERLHPSGDVSDGSWTTNSGGTSLSDAIDETSVDDADYIQSSYDPTNDTCEVHLGNPASGMRPPLKVRYRYKKQGSQTLNLTVRLMQGSSIVASWSHTNIGTDYLVATQVLTSGESELITDYSDLRLRFIANAP